MYDKLLGNEQLQNWKQQKAEIMSRTNINVNSDTPVPQEDMDESIFKENNKDNKENANKKKKGTKNICLLYTSDAADDMQCVDLGGRRIIKKCGLTLLGCRVWVSGVFSSRRRHTRCREVSWARRCV